MKLPLLFLFSLLALKSTSQSIETAKSLDERISTPLNERDFTMSPDGNEIYFTRGSFNNKVRFIAYSKLVGDEWSAPEVVSFSGQFNDLEPFISPDGKRLFFASNRSANQVHQKRDYDIWYVERTKDGWGEAIQLDTIINTPKNEFYPSLSKNGNLYFTATRKDTKGTEDIYMSEWIDGQFAKPSSLPTTINSKTYEYNAYISPEEDLLIFGSYGRADDMGGGDLYYSRKDDTGKWRDAQHFDGLINSSDLDYCPYFDHKNSLLYFTSNIGIKPPLEDLEIYEKLSLGILNGFGNVYTIPYRF